MRVNCDFCSDLVYANEAKSNGQITLCLACWGTLREIDINFTSLNPQTCEVCSAEFLENAQDYSEWHGTGPHPLICRSCVVQYTPENSKKSIEGLRQIIGDA